MKVLKSFEELKSVIDDYRQNLESYKKPIMIWFESNNELDGFKRMLLQDIKVASMIGHPLAGHERIVIDGEIVKISDHPEVWKKTLLPSVYKEGQTELLVCHLYMSQMETIHLEYCVSLVEEKNIPVVHFANTYNYDQRPSWVEERFAEYHLKVE